MIPLPGNTLSQRVLYFQNAYLEALNQGQLIDEDHQQIYQLCIFTLSRSASVNLNYEVLRNLYERFVAIDRKEGFVYPAQQIYQKSLICIWINYLKFQRAKCRAKHAKEVLKKEIHQAFQEIEKSTERTAKSESIKKYGQKQSELLKIEKADLAYSASYDLLSSAIDEHNLFLAHDLVTLLNENRLFSFDPEKKQKIFLDVSRNLSYKNLIIRNEVTDLAKLGEQIEELSEFDLRLYKLLENSEGLKIDWQIGTERLNQEFLELFNEPPFEGSQNMTFISNLIRLLVSRSLKRSITWSREEPERKRQKSIDSMH